jgi:hypothetical protein
MNSAYNAMITEALWPIKLALAIVVAYLVHEWVRDIFDDHDDPDGYA